jgi:hypothetical protein
LNFLHEISFDAPNILLKVVFEMAVNQNRTPWMKDGDFDGVRVSKWDRASQISQHALHLNEAAWALSLEMYADPELCLPFMQTVFKFWGYVKSIASNASTNAKIIELIDKDFEKAFKIASEMPYEKNAHTAFAKTRELCIFENKVTEFAQKTGWGLPVKRVDVGEEDTLEKASEI